ncbi:MAG: S8 family peptidase [Acidimicrobiales bacterium]
MADPGPPVGDLRPLLAFPAPATVKIPPSDQPSRFRPVKRPSATHQGTRLTPQFNELRKTLEGGRAQLAESTTASDPELVAVFDLAGAVDGFLRAATGVEGLEFLSELQEDYVESDDDFFYEDNGGERSDTDVPQSLYMIMTNTQAVTELIRLFELWQRDPKVKFATGLNPLKEVFGLLRGIRLWGPEDRVRETGLLDQWREDLEVAGAQGITRVEIELWYRRDQAARRLAESEVRTILVAAGADVIASAERPEIAYHAVLANVPMSEVEQVLADGPDAIELLKTESVMMVSGSRAMIVETSDSVTAGPNFDEVPVPSGPPRVALLDGVPLTSHAALDRRLVVDDPDDRTAKYGTAQRRHGTAMASLIAHGDLSDLRPPAMQPIYVRPIFEPHPFATRAEVIPEGELLVDLIYRCIHRMFEGDGGQPPSAPSVRIITIAVGDPVRVFVRRLSPLARLLDWLSHLYNVVIVVSGGNHSATKPVLSTATLDDPNAVAADATRSLFRSARHRRLLSPAEAVNAITVGALHADGLDADFPDTVINPIPAGSPASYSPVGFGFRRSVKPEILLPGGRQIFSAPLPGAGEDTVALDVAASPLMGPGLQAAAPGMAGELDAITFSCGTSNAAALASRSLSGIMDVLESARSEDGDPPFPDAQYHPVLAKALLVHAAGWHDSLDWMRDILGLSGQDVRRELTRILGYGPVHDGRVATAERTRVVLLGAGSIKKDRRHTFNFPLPPALAATTEWRRLTITLAWLSPVNVHSQKYRMARLLFTPAKDDLRVSPLEADANAVFKGTVQHQVLEGSAAVGYVAGSSLAIDVDCRVDAGSLKNPVRFGLAASLEVAASVNIDLHAEVRTQTQAMVRDRVRAQVPRR